MAIRDRIIFALDVPDFESAKLWTKKLSSKVGWFKVGLELFTATGPEIVKVIKENGFKCFLDLKFHDIPNTVAGSVRSAVRIGADMMTIHLSGGASMITAAREAAISESGLLGISTPKIIGVSVLTSLNQDDLYEIGVRQPLQEQVMNLALLASKNLIDGMVCSPEDLPYVRGAVPKDFIIITPGIRPGWSIKGDQKRIATPQIAIQQGADLLVIGRPISQAPDPIEAVDKIVEEMEL